MGEVLRNVSGSTSCYVMMFGIYSLKGGGANDYFKEIEPLRFAR